MESYGPTNVRNLLRRLLDLYNRRDDHNDGRLPLQWAHIWKCAPHPWSDRFVTRSLQALPQRLDIARRMGVEKTRAHDQRWTPQSSFFP